MKRYLFVILVIFISGCCSYNKSDLEFNAKELAHFADYKSGDIIYFQSNLGDIDTIKIVGFGTERNERCPGLNTPPPVNHRWLQIEHLPVDRWFGTSITEKKTEVVYQELLSISKYPIETGVYYSISFKDFHSKILPKSTVGEFHTDTIKLNNLNLTNYYLVRHGYPERITEPKNIEIIYWTDKFGLTAYKAKDGEIWTKKFTH